MEIYVLRLIQVMIFLHHNYRMIMHTIENEYLRVGVLGKGAELASILELDKQQEYIWQANDPKFWGRHSSILFPVIGACNNDVIRLDGKLYPMPKHGIVRNAKFEIGNKSKDQIVFVLKSSSETREHYPFDWTLKVYYELVEKSLSVIYEVTNDDLEDLPYSIGAHPAFNCPNDKGKKRSDYSLIFDKEEYQDSPRIDSNGLILEDAVNILNESNAIRIKDNLFENDALILTHYKSSKVSLQVKDNPEIEVSIEGFSHLGIWSNPEVPPFVCIEPWCGIADPVGYEGNMHSKPGILLLAPRAVARHTHVISVL
ncbi:MAG: galactose mutarotase-like enzyme [Saprospiraceae bacterium]